MSKDEKDDDLDPEAALIARDQLMDILESINTLTDMELAEIGLQWKKAQCLACGSESWLACRMSEQGNVAHCTDCPPRRDVH